MEFNFQLVSKEAYDDGREDRIRAASLKVGSLCTVRQISPGLKDAYAVDASVRVAKVNEPGEGGRRLVELAVVDPEGKDITRFGVPIHCHVMLGADDFLYDGAAEEGYFPADPWDMSNLDNLITTADAPAQTVDLTRTLVAV